MFNNFFFRKSCRLWENVEKYGTAKQATDDNIIRRMRFACWITKSTNTHLACVIIIAFTRQQWLHERASMLRLYVHCLSRRSLLSPCPQIRLMECMFTVYYFSKQKHVILDVPKNNKVL
jgi:hypothetical protein